MFEEVKQLGKIRFGEREYCAIEKSLVKSFAREIAVGARWFDHVFFPSPSCLPLYSATR